jgi:HD-like signal output (HDOD) protein
VLVARLFAELDRVSEEGDRAFLTRLVRDCGAARLDFPLFPDAALRLDGLLRKGDPSVSAVADIVKREPDLVRRVWQQASGVAYGGKAPGSLDAAIVRIGYDALWRIGMSACTNAPVFRVRGFEASANHVRGLSIVSSETAAAVLPGPEPFLAALLHGVGRLLFYRCAVVRPGAPAPEPARVEALARALYPNVGVLIADAWGFGSLVAAGVGYAADPSRAPEDTRAVARAVRAAHIAAVASAEARAGREVGGLAALMALSEAPEPGRVRFDAARVLRAADSAWAGVTASG